LAKISGQGLDTLHLHQKEYLRKPLANNRIRAPEVRLIDKTGKQLGILPLKEALQKAKERSLDLVQVTEKVKPPVCKIVDYGKYLYSLEKKQRKSKKKGGELKGIRLTYNISPHDLETKVKLAEKFLKRGDRVRIEMLLRGRERALEDFAREKISQFLEALNKKIPLKEEGGIRKRGRRLTMTIVKK
jgi:translation initiation factor IF-3